MLEFYMITAEKIFFFRIFMRGHVPHPTHPPSLPLDRTPPSSYAYAIVYNIVTNLYHAKFNDDRL